MEARDLRGGDRPGHAEETFGPLTASRSATANKCLMSRSFTMLRLLAAVLLLACARQPSPEEVALEYGRALYANDRAAAYRLLSSDDRRLKDAEAFRAQAGQVTGFALEASRRLAAFMVATSVERTVAGARVTIKLKLKMPDANAQDVQTVVGAWDERRLNALPQAERMRIMEKLQGLGTVGRLPMVEGEETFELVKEAAGWRVFLNLAGGVRVQFHARASKSLALGLNVSPEEARVVPGDRVRVTVRATRASAGQPSSGARDPGRLFGPPPVSPLSARDPLGRPVSGVRLRISGLERRPRGREPVSGDLRVPAGGAGSLIRRPEVRHPRHGAALLGVGRRSALERLAKTGHPLLVVEHLREEEEERAPVDEAVDEPHQGPAWPGSPRGRPTGR